MIDGPRIACAASCEKMKITPDRLGGGGEVFRRALKLGRLNQREFGQVLGVLEIFNLEAQSIHRFSIVRHGPVSITHYFSDPSVLEAFDGFERLQGQTGLA